MRYATVTSWAEYFEKEEGIKIRYNTILDRLRKVRKVGITARSSVGRILKNSFYSESDVRSACADLLQNMPQADEKGFFERDGVKYGTIRAWSKILPISSTPINSRVEQFQKNSIKGRLKGGQIHIFYSEADVRSACADLLQNLPQADKDGFLVKDGIKYATLDKWSKTLFVSRRAIKIRLRKKELQKIEGKTKDGQVCDFYPEPDIHSACKNLLNPELPQSDKSGFFTKDSIKYGTIHSWSKLLPISTPGIMYRLEQFQIEGIKGRDIIGRIYKFYSEKDIYSVCADLLEELPQTDENGFFEKDSIKYGTIHSWSKLLSISEGALVRRLEQSQVENIKGRGRRRQIRNFYSEPDIRSACADILEANNYDKAL